MNKNLFADDGGSDEDIGFNTNKDYAKSYNTFRQKELLKKLKDKDDADASDSSSESESSDDDESAFNPKFDAEFFKTLSSLKRKDPTIYEKSTKFFDDDGNEAGNATTSNDMQPPKKTKKLTIKQYEQDLLLKNSDILERDSDDDAHNARAQSPSYNEEQKMIKNEILGKIGGIDASDDDDDDDDDDGIGGLFSKREKTQKEQEEDDKEQAHWLDENSEFREKSINEIWANKKLTKDEKFLRDYILSNGYADKDDDEIPTYDEIVGDNDEDFEEKQLEFEHKYNFRFEDPDQEFIKRYPRTVENSVRKVDSRRKEKRVERRERKELEKKEKFKEIEMLKEFKRNEIEEKLAQLKAVTGTEELNVDEIDLDGDFDPDEYDKKMQAIFNNEYYAVDEGDEKPEAPSDIEDLQVENYDEIDKDDENADHDAEPTHCEDQDFNMDCDYDPVAAAERQKKSFQDEIIDSTRSNKRRQRKRKSKFMEMLETKRPQFDPDDTKSFTEYLDEYYKLDCEDIIGDVKCRFKYVETTPCDYGLSIEEILGAKNKELNAWASLKKATQIRPEHVERNDQMIFQKKAKNETLKRKILQSLYEPSDDEDDTMGVTEEVKKPKVIVDNKPLTRINCAADDDEEEKPGTSNAVNQNQELNKKKTKKKKPKKTNNNSAEDSAAPEASQKSEEKDNKNDIVKIETQVKPAAQVRPVAQPTKSAARKIPPTGKAQVKQKDRLSKVAHKTIDKRNRQNKQNKQKSLQLSDERLKAFGINPKKFAKQQKYAARSNQQIHPVNKTNKKPQAAQKAKQTIKLKSKLKKALKSSK